jgi:hypothetical protein
MSRADIQGSTPWVTFGSHSRRASATCLLRSFDQLIVTLNAVPVCAVMVPSSSGGM